MRLALPRFACLLSLCYLTALTLGSLQPDRSSGTGASIKRMAKRAPQYKLPPWFHFELYKKLFGKSYSSGISNERHKRQYLRTALRVLEQRARFRAGRTDSLASVNELSDLTSAELAAFRESRKPVEWPPGDPALGVCCSYDQVYRRVIELLNKTSETDPTLSRALVDELQQKALFQDQQPDLKRQELVGVAGSSSKSEQTASGNEEISGSEDADASKLAGDKVLASTSIGATEISAAQRQQATAGNFTTAKALDGLANDKLGNPFTAQQLPVNPELTPTEDTPTSESERKFMRAVEDSVRRQVVETLSDSELGRQLTRQYSALHGAPVKLRVSVGSQATADGAAGQPLPEAAGRRPAKAA